MQKVIITNEAEREAALERARELMGCTSRKRRGARGHIQSVRRLLGRTMQRMTEPPRSSLKHRVARVRTATQILAALALWGALKLGLLASLLAGLLVYELVHLMAPGLSGVFAERRVGKNRSPELFGRFGDCRNRGRGAGSGLALVGGIREC
jgi:hypothetical protein